MASKNWIIQSFGDFLICKKKHLNNPERTDSIVIGQKLTSEFYLEMEGILLGDLFEITGKSDSHSLIEMNIAKIKKYEIFAVPLEANIHKLLHKCIMVNCFEEIQFLPGIMKPFQNKKKRINVDKIIHKCKMTNCFKEMLIRHELNKPPSEEQEVAIAINQIYRALHKRQMAMCVEEMLSLHGFLKYKRGFVLEWLKGIDLDDIEPYKLDPPLNVENYKKIRIGI